MGRRDNMRILRNCVVRMIGFTRVRMFLEKDTMWI